MQKIQKSIGAVEAREKLPLLLEGVIRGAGAVEITDLENRAAVLVSKQEYEWLIACAEKNPQPKRDPRGFFVLTDDYALEDASAEISVDFEKSMARCASEL
jgi:hypothetical protein